MYENVSKNAPKTPPKISEYSFVWYLRYLLNLSADSRRQHPAWQFMKKELTKAGHWKKSYTK